MKYDGTVLNWGGVSGKEPSGFTEYTIEQITETNKVLHFLEEIDPLLPTPVSSVMSLPAYVKKVQAWGKILAVEKNGRIKGAILFYCNDHKTRNAFVTLIGVLPEFQRNKMGLALMLEAEKVSTAHGMRYIRLEADFSNKKAIAFYTKLGFSVEFSDKKLHFRKALD